MAHRTAKDARAWLEMNAIALNPEAYRQFEAEIRAVEGRHVAHAMEIVNSELSSYTAEHREVLTDGCDLRDDYEQLAKDAATGRLSAAEYRGRLIALDNQVPSFSRRVDRLARKINTVETIESDPVAYTDGIFEKTPALQKPHFSF
jgi:chromosome segregation ATPase